MKIKILILILFLLFPATAFSEESQPVEILLFGTAHCHACQKIKAGIIPRVKEKYAGKIKIEDLDFDKPENLMRLMELEDKYDWHSKEDQTPTIFINGKFLVGSIDIETYLEMYIDSALSEKGYTPFRGSNESVDLLSRFKAFSPLAIMSAGLIDGINPCAFTVIIFFISFLTLQGYRRREIFAIALAFITAVFITYVLIGIGLFNFIFQLKGYYNAVKVLYISGAALCFVLAGLAFYDYLKFKQTGRTEELVLQLPKGFKDRIQRIIGLHYRKDKGSQAQDKGKNIWRLVLSAFTVGFFVSLFEAICTGQVYLPTIVFVLKSTHLKLQALFYLLIYNLMFILPLWIIMLFAILGVSSGQFSSFVSRHMGIIKILMAGLFVGLGLFLAWQ